MPSEEVMSREAMKQALEALELLAKYENPSTKIQVRKPKDGGPIVTMYPHKVATEAAALLRDRLAQPEQEPVAWANSLDFDDDDQEIISAKDKGKLGTSNCDIALYIAPPKKWVGLTDGEHDSIKRNYHDMTWTLEMFARAIEQALKEKNT
jgi:hypothetical protein